jgi:alcohol dehydrogenase
MGNRDEFAALVGHIESGRLRPLVWATYPLAELARAQADFQRKSFVGKLVAIP